MDTETRILQAAEKEFLEKGFAGARTASIAEAAGVNHAMLHYYFRTKEKLFERIIFGKISTMGKIVSEAIGDGNLPLEERIRQGVERHFDFIAANPNLPKFFFNEVLSRPEYVEMAKQNMSNVLDGLIGGLQQEIDSYAAAGKCVQTDALTVFIDIISLNIFPFFASPLLKGIAANYYNSYDEFLSVRKQENIETILRKLKIH